MGNMRKKPKGWRGDSLRHSMASKGVKTKGKKRMRTQPSGVREANKFAEDVAGLMLLPVTVATEATDVVVEPVRQTGSALDQSIKPLKKNGTKGVNKFVKETTEMVTAPTEATAEVAREIAVKPTHEVSKVFDETVRKK